MNSQKSSLFSWLLIPAGIVAGLLFGIWFRSTFLKPDLSALSQTAAKPENAIPSLKQPGRMPEKQGMTIIEFETSIRKAMRNPSQESREDALCLLAKSIELSDIPKLLPALGNYSNAIIIQNLNDVLFRRWAGTNPKEAWAYAQTLAPSARRMSSLASVLGEWVRSEPSAAIEQAAHLSEGGEKRQLMRALVTALAALDPKKAMAVASSSASDVKNLQNTVLQSWAAIDPAGAAVALASFPDKDSDTLRLIASNWAQRDAASAVAWMKSLPGLNPFGNNFSEVLVSLVQANPDAAAQYLRGFPANQSRDHAMWMMGVMLCRYDINAASLWVERLQDDSGKRQAQIAVLQQWAEYDPKSAVEYGSKLPADIRDTDLFQDVVKIWGKTDPHAACGWVSQQAESKNRNLMLLKLIQSWAAQAPGDAGSLVAKWPPGALQDDAAALVLGRWTETNPQAAVSWVSQFPESNTRDRSVESVIRQWSKRDPEAAGNWIKEFPAGNTRDAALAAYADALTQSHDAANALSWAQNISNEALRFKTMESSARAWLYRDPALARAWVDQSALPSQIKQELLK